MKRLSVIAVALLLGGCATVIDGRSQQIQLTSNAPGASCGITQNGVQIVAPEPVPATHHCAAGRASDRNLRSARLSAEHSGADGRSQSVVSCRASASILVGAGADAAFGGLAEYQDQAYIHLKPI